MVGLDGTIDDRLPVLGSWTWEGSFNYGRSDASQASHGGVIRSHLKNALGPTFTDDQGTHCGTSAASAIDGCVPLDLLHPGSRDLTQDALDYLAFTGTQSGFNEQHTALLQASGKLLDLPNHAGISLAIGGDYRFERGGLQPDPLTAAGDTLGNAFQPTLGSYHTFEGFGELSFVPIAGGEILKWLEINLKLNFFTTWLHPSGVGAGFHLRFIDSYLECEQDNCNDPVHLRRDVSSYLTGDRFVTCNLNTSQARRPSRWA